MSYSTVTVPSLNALFKEVYAEQVEKLIPERERVLKNVPFVAADKQNGSNYNQPVILSRDHGVTYLGQNSNNLRLNAPIAAIVDVAQIKASGMVMRSLMDYQSASRASKGGAAFVDGTSYLVESLTDSFSAILEQTHWYGGRGLASATTAAGADFSGAVFTVPVGQWAPAVWVGAEGMLCDVYSSADGITPALLKASALEVVGVNITTRQITFKTLTVTGWTPSQYDMIFRHQAKGLESLGIQQILGNTGSLFGVDASTRGLWKANTYAVTSAGTEASVGTTNFSYGAAADGIAIAYGRGLEGQLDLHVNSLVFSSLIPNFATAKTASTSSQGMQFQDPSLVEDLRYGAKTITFIVNNVEVNVLANDYVKAGLAFGLAQGTWLRVGSSQLTFDLPDVDKGNYFRPADGYAAIELRAFADEAIFCKKPARNIMFHSIKPT